MNYREATLYETVHIDALFTVHYFEYTSDFVFEGESHNFWEFICVDKGTVEIGMDEQTYTLRKNDIAFHEPNEFHKVSTRGQIAPNLVVISFKTDSPFMDFFRKRILKIDEKERAILADIIKEARSVYASPLNAPYLTELERKEDVPIGAEQLIKIHLEHFLIHLMRRHTSCECQTPESPALKSGSDTFKRIVQYMEENLSKPLTIAQICRDNTIGRTQLQMIFQKEASSSAFEYFISLKVNAAKRLIRLGELNFTQISEQLGYSSIYYFSRQFKKVTGMTPSEYVSSIKAIVEKK